MDSVLSPAIKLLDSNYRDAYQQLMSRVRELEQRQNCVEVDNGKYLIVFKKVLK